MTLDSFVKEYDVERVDFIKIDTEDSEREILKGAKETIRKFKPRMAIAAYHLLPDDKKIPEIPSLQYPHIFIFPSEEI